MVVTREVEEEGRANSEEGDVKGPDILEGGFNSENLLRADKFLEKVSTTVVRKKTKDRGFDPFPESGRENKEKSDIGEKGDNEDVDEERARGERERREKKPVSLETSLSFGGGGSPEVLKCNIPSD